MRVTKSAAYVIFGSGCTPKNNFDKVKLHSKKNVYQISDFTMTGVSLFSILKKRQNIHFWKGPKEFWIHNLRTRVFTEMRSGQNDREQY